MAALVRSRYNTEIRCCSHLRFETINIYLHLSVRLTCISFRQRLAMQLTTDAPPPPNPERATRPTQSASKEKGGPAHAAVLAIGSSSAYQRCVIHSLTVRVPREGGRSSFSKSLNPTVVRWPHNKQAGGSSGHSVRAPTRREFLEPSGKPHNRRTYSYTLKPEHSGGLVGAR